MTMSGSGDGDGAQNDPGLNEARLKEIEAFARVLRDSPVLAEIEVRDQNAVLRLRRRSVAAGPPAATAAARSGPARVPTTAAAAGITQAATNGAAASVSSTASSVAADAHIEIADFAPPAVTPIKAGLVGVFHAARPPLVCGDAVKKQQTVGQIEAMRLMSECHAPTSGVVAQVLVEEGQPVEYGQTLFEIAADAAATATTASQQETP